MDEKPPNPWIILALFAAVVAAGAGALLMFIVMRAMHPPGSGMNQAGAGAMQEMPPALVRVGVAEVAEVQDRFPIVGRLRELQRATVAAEVSGKVLSVPVEEGDSVVGGQTVLVEIEGVWANLALKSAEAKVAAQRATLDQARRDLAQLEQLATVSSAKPKEVADARAQVETEQALLDEAIAEMDRAREQVERLRILAPFDGVVVKKMAEVGQWVEEGTDVMEVVSQGRIDALIDVPERLINQVRVGDSMTVLLDALSLEVEGEVASVNPSGISAARTFPVKIRLDDRGGELKPGMSVIAMLPIGEKGPRLTVPRDAVLYRGGAASVWAAQAVDEATSLAQPVPVRVLFGVGDRMAVEPVIPADTERLAEGTPVVVEGAERLAPGQPLQMDQTPATAGNGGVPEPETQTSG